MTGNSLRRASRTAQTAGAVMVAMGVSALGVPERMMLTSTMKSAPLKSAPMVELDFNVGVQEVKTIQREEMIGRHAGSFGSVAFVVRRPG